MVGLIVLGGGAGAEVGSEAGRSLLELLETAVEGFEAAESGGFFGLQGVGEGGQGLVAEVGGSLAKGLGQLVEGFLFCGGRFQAGPDSGGVAAGLPQMPGIEGDGDVMGGLAQKEFAGPACGRGLNLAQPGQTAVYTASFFVGLEEVLADGLALFLEVDGLHFAEGAEAFGRIEQAVVEGGRFTVEAAARFAVPAGQPAQAERQQPHQEQKGEYQDS